VAAISRWRLCWISVCKEREMEGRKNVGGQGPIGKGSSTTFLTMRKGEKVDELLSLEAATAEQRLLGRKPCEACMGCKHL